MAWLDGGWGKRVAITVDVASAAGTYDAQGAIPKDWDEFWDNVDATGDEVRVTLADGYTLATYDIASFNKTTRAATIQVDSLTLGSAEGIVLLWLYFDNSGATDASSAVTITSAQSLYIELAQPRTQRTLAPRPEASGAAKAALNQAKEDDVTTYLWWDVSAWLHDKRVMDNGSRRNEELDYCKFEVEAAGTPVGTMVDATKNRFAEVSGVMYVVTLVKAGTAGTVYLAKLTFTTSTPNSLTQTEVAKSRLTIQDITES